MLETERHLLERLTLLDSIPSLRAIGNAGNRSAYMASLRRKAADPWRPEWQRALEADAELARHGDEAKAQLVSGPPAPRPVHSSSLTLMASHAEIARGRARVADEAAVIRRALAEREARRQAMVAATTGGEIGAHQRALDRIARMMGR